MNEAAIHRLIDGALTRAIKFSEILAALAKEGVEAYHVDFIRNEYRYYAKNGETFVTSVPLIHDGVAAQFSAEKIDAINKRVQAGEAWYPDFVKEGAAAGCAYYIVYLNGRKVRYFGRDGGEHIQYFPGAQLAIADAPVSRSAIKFVDIQAAPEKVFAFLANPMNWPKYAIVNLRSVSPGKDGWFDVVTKFGQGQLKISATKELGIFDHVWKDPQASWQVYSRVVPNGSGATVSMTLFQPPVMDDQMFAHAMKEMDVEMAKLKEILER